MSNESAKILNVYEKIIEKEVMKLFTFKNIGLTVGDKVIVHIDRIDGNEKSNELIFIGVDDTFNKNFAVFWDSKKKLFRMIGEISIVGMDLIERNIELYKKYDILSDTLKEISKGD